MADKLKIPTRAKFDALPKAQKVELVRKLRKEYDDNVIRDAWNFSPGAYYQLLYRNGLSSGGKKGRPLTKTTAPQPPKEEIRMDRMPNDENWPRRKIIEADVMEAEYSVVEEEPKPQQSYAPAVIKTEESVDLPFPAIKGTPAQLRKTFEAVVMFLEAQESEETRFEIRLSVVKA